MPSDVPIRVPTGRLLFISPTVLVYAPWRATVAEARNSLQRIHREGILRPVPGKEDQRERVYPIDYCPTEDRDVFGALFAREDGEVFDVTLYVRNPGERTETGPMNPTEPPVLVDPFAR